MDYTNLDTIIIKTEEEFQTILNWNETNKETYFNNVFGWVFTEGVLEFGYESSRYVFSIGGDIVHLIICINTNILSKDTKENYEEMVSFDFNFKKPVNEIDNSIGNINYYIKDTSLKIKGKTYKEYAQEIITVALFRFLQVMIYCSNYKEELEVVEEIERKPKNKKEQHIVNKAKYKENREVKLFKKTYNISTTHDTEEKRNYTKCEHEFTVRGHHRKIGDKVIWIEPYTKGKGTHKSKRYTL